MMNDIEPESDIEEISTAAASSAPMQQVVKFVPCTNLLVLICTGRDHAKFSDGTDL